MQGHPSWYNQSHVLHIIKKKKKSTFGINLLHLIGTLSTILRNRDPAELKVPSIKEEMTAQSLHVFKSHFNSEMFPDSHEYLCYL